MSEINFNETHSEVQNPVPSKSSRKKGFFRTFISRHTGVFVLLCLLIAVVIVAFIRIKLLERSFNKQRETLLVQYQTKVDSVLQSDRLTTVKVFSWAVRSELIRDNRDQVNQFFMNFIKEPGVKKIKLIDPVSAKAIISTDKKEEGLVFADPAIFTEEIAIRHRDSVTQIISPVMGLNEKIGVLVIEYE